jgi:hypothetical protein
MNSKLPRWIVSPSEKPLHIKHSPSVEKVSTDEGTIRTSIGKAHHKSPFLVRQLLVFFAPANYGVVKIARSSFEVVMWTMKHTMIYTGSCPSSEVIALYPVVWYWRWTYVTKGWAESSRSSRGERGKRISSLLPEG